jgi:cytochrome P450
MSALRLAVGDRSVAEFRGNVGRRGRIVRELVNDICPTQYTMRRATTDVRIGGQPIDEGELIAIPLGQPNGLPFGAGRHSCPGMRIALAEAEFALGRFGELMAADWSPSDVVWKEHPVFHGLERAIITRSG